jgi:hypothetical protein
LVAIGLLTGAEGSLLTHAHVAETPTIGASAPGAPVAPTGAAPDCAACHARAAVDALVVDAHPERHGAAPCAAPPLDPHGAPPARGLAPAPARAPPHRIV